MEVAIGVLVVLVIFALIAVGAAVGPAQAAGAPYRVAFHA